MTGSLNISSTVKANKFVFTDGVINENNNDISSDGNNRNKTLNINTITTPKPHTTLSKTHSTPSNYFHIQQNYLIYIF